MMTLRNRQNGFYKLGVMELLYAIEGFEFRQHQGNYFTVFSTALAGMHT